MVYSNTAVSVGGGGGINMVNPVTCMLSLFEPFNDAFEVDFFSSSGLHSYTISQTVNDSM